MQEAQPSTSRKKFLLWSATILSSATVFKFIRVPKKKKTDMVKMLTQEGKLVEIDKKLLVSPGKKITDKELQQWVKK
ncbi:MAG TPA: hypothetical protein VLS85_06120 [Hanamia sp.]|nr:hypothetical protein [Hanamia sp.]